MAGWGAVHIWCIDARIAASLGGSAGGAALGGGGVRLGALSEALDRKLQWEEPAAGRRVGTGAFTAFAANGSLSRPTGIGSAPADCS